MIDTTDKWTPEQSLKQITGTAIFTIKAGALKQARKAMKDASLPLMFREIAAGVITTADQQPHPELN